MSGDHPPHTTRRGKVGKFAETFYGKLTSVHSLDYVYSQGKAQRASDPLDGGLESAGEARNKFAGLGWGERGMEHRRQRVNKDANFVKGEDSEKANRARQQGKHRIKRQTE